MSVTPADIAAFRQFQSVLQRLGTGFGAPPAAGPGQPQQHYQDYGVNLFQSQGPTGGATVISDDNHILVRGEHNAVVIYAVGTPDAISPGSTPTASIQILDSPYAKNSFYTATVDPQGTLSGITTATKVIVSGVQPYIKANINVTHGLWSVFACTVPAANTSTINIPGNINVASFGGTATSLGQKVMGSSIPVTLASDQSALPVTIAATLSDNLTQYASTNVGPANPIDVRISGLTFATDSTLNLTTATTQLPSHPCKAIYLENIATSTQNLLWGDSVNQAFILTPGQKVILSILNTNQIWAKWVTSSATLNFGYFGGTAG